MLVEYFTIDYARAFDALQVGPSPSLTGCGPYLW